MNFVQQVNIELIKRGQSKKWLVEEVNSITGRHIDRIYLWRVINRKINSSVIMDAICQILNLDNPYEGD